jgi:hypothetical protein
MAALYTVSGCSPPNLTIAKILCSDYIGVQNTICVRDSLININPRPTITIALQPDGISYIITFFSCKDIIDSFTVIPSQLTISSGNFLAVGFGQTNLNDICGQLVAGIFVITATVIKDFDCYLLINDTYTITVGTNSDGLLIANVQIQRPVSPSFSNTPTILNSVPAIPLFPECPCPQKCKEQVLVPGIVIEGQTTYDGSNLASMKFIITDEVTYYDHKPIVGTQCGIFFIDRIDVKETIFRKCCCNISLFPVLKGKGKSSYEKALYLWERDSDLQSTTCFYKFYQTNLTLYAMSRYILSRILYGKFNIKFLLGKFAKSFFEDLGNSRFCGALCIYNGKDHLATYSKYFKFE